MKTAASFVGIALACAFSNAAWSQSQGVSLRQEMTAEEIRATGLGKLSPAEIEALEKWIGRRKAADAAKVAAAPSRCYVADGWKRDVFKGAPLPSW